MAEERIQVGGQAVIEGVMMRSKDSYAVAVRRRDGSIYVRRRPYRSLVHRYRLLAWPILRGAVVLIESLVLGTKALTFSSDVAMADERAHNGAPAKRKNREGRPRCCFHWRSACLFFSMYR